MLINHRFKLISVSVPKTGSTTLHYALMRATGEKFKAKSPGPAIYHMPVEDIAKIMGPNFAEYFSYGVVRNPYDRMVSLYHDFRDQRGAIKARSFDSFILNGFNSHWQNNVHFLPQTFFLCNDDGLMVSAAYKFETGMENVLAELAQRVGFETAQVGHARKSERSDWREYYKNPRVADVVSEHYRSDFETFGYERI